MLPRPAHRSTMTAGQRVFRELQVSSVAVAETCQCPIVACQFYLPDDIIITNKLSCHNDGRVNSGTDGLWARSGFDRLNIRKFCHEERTTKEMILISAGTSILRKIIREIRYLIMVTRIATFKFVLISPGSYCLVTGTAWWWYSGGRAEGSRRSTSNLDTTCTATGSTTDPAIPSCSMRVKH